MESPSLKPLVIIEQQAIALLFNSYLRSLGIQSQVITVDEGYQVLCPEDTLAVAHQEFLAFIRNPHAEKYQQAAWHQGEVTDINQTGPGLMQVFRQQFVSHAGGVTLTVFALCWLVFIASLVGWAVDIFQQLRFFSQLNLTALATEPWRLIGPAFFHFSWLHIVFNTLWWWQLGGDVERQLGKSTLINLALLSAIVSNLGQYLVSGANFGGLSGVVYGLVGFVWWAGWLMPQKGLVLARPIIGLLLFWMLLGFAELLPMNMANTAHLLGLVSGCFYAWWQSRIVKQ